MNVNEVIAHLASKALGKPVHPNDHVNMCQSSNDVIPSAIHLSALIESRNASPGARTLARSAAAERARMGRSAQDRPDPSDGCDADDAGSGSSGWRAQIDNAIARLKASEPRLRALAQGGTAIGTGINAHEKFAATFIEELRSRHQARSHAGAKLLRRHGFAGCRGRVLGPVAHARRGAHEDLQRPALDEQRSAGGSCGMTLPALQPGSSIMPGKVNPVDSRGRDDGRGAGDGLDAAIAIAGQSGNFQLNVMLPLIGRNLLESIRLLTNALSRSPTSVCRARNRMSRVSTKRCRATRYSSPRSIR